MLVTDRLHSCWPLPELIERAVAGGVDAVQIREKDLDDSALLSLIESLMTTLDDRSRFLVNGSLKAAVELGIGVHLPEGGDLPALAREALGPRALIGRSVHSVAAIEASDGADYLIAGHVFASQSKPGLPPLGLSALAEIVREAPVPVIAIGGIDADNVWSVLATGVHGIAVMSAITGATHPESAARRIRDRLDAFTRYNVVE